MGALDMFQVVKRDGEVDEFKIGKITAAIHKAFDAKEKNYSEEKITDNKITVEEIQDSVENVLIQAGYADVAKAYILYRKQREKVRNMKSTILDYKEIVNSYVKVEDWRVKENSTVTYSVGGLILSNSGAVTANYWLSEIYDNEIADAHRNADIHIHDLSMLTGYCAGWSLKQLIKEGLGGIEGKITSAPAKHLSVLCNQMVNFLGIMQNEWAGAQAFSSFDTYLAPFVKADNLSYPEVKKCIESFIYGVNTPSRWGTQAPFSNITLDWTVPDDLAELPAIVGGKNMDFKYKDCKKEMDMINKAFIETMIEGDANGRGFQYPIPTYSITNEFDWSDTENNRLLFEMTSKYGTPYFSNYINSDMKPSDIRSMCCRLRLDLRELRKKSGGFFGSGESTGSVGVVTINMPRIAYLSKTPEEFYNRLDRLMDISARSLHIKREVIGKLLDEGLYPYTKRYLGSFSNHFSTIGLVGMNEVGLNARWLGKDMSDERTQRFTKEVLLHMRERLSDYQENCLILRQLLLNLLPIVWPNMTENAGRILRLQARKGILLIIQTVLIFRLNIPQIFLMHWIFRMICRRFIHQVLYSMHLSVRSFLTGKQQQHWYVRSQRIINCRIIRFRRPILYVRNMATSAESISLVRNVVRRRRFTVVSQDITDLYRTGMTVKHRSIRTVRFMM